MFFFVNDLSFIHTTFCLFFPNFHSINYVSHSSLITCLYTESHASIFFFTRFNRHTEDYYSKLRSTKSLISLRNKGRMLTRRLIYLYNADKRDRRKLEKFKYVVLCEKREDTINRKK